jgi:hypothetical protein
MNAMLVVKTKSGYAVAAYEGELPPNFVQDMDVASHISHYSYSKATVAKILEGHFEPPEQAPEAAPVQLKEAA